MFLATLTLSALGDMVAHLSSADWVDIGCAVFLVLGLALGTYRGLSASLPAGIHWLCGLLVAWYIRVPVLEFCKGLAFFQGRTEYAAVAALVAVILLGIGVLVLVKLWLGHIGKQMEAHPVANRIFGGMAGLLRFALFLLVVATSMRVVPWKTGGRVFCLESRVGQWSAPITDAIFQKAKEVRSDHTLNNAVNSGEEIFHSLRANAGPTTNAPSSGTVPVPNNH